MNWRKRLSLVSMAGLLTVTPLLTGFIGEKVNIQFNGSKKEISLKGQTLADALKEEGILVSDKTWVSPELTTPLDELRDKEIVVSQERDRVLIVDGQIKRVRVAGDTVQGILGAAGVYIEDQDQVLPARDQVVPLGTVVQVTTHRTSKSVQTREIPFTKETVETDRLYKGQSKVIQKGINGIINDQVEVTKIAGQVTGTMVTASQVVQEMLPEITQVGTKERPQTSTYSKVNFEGKQVLKKIVMQATAYDPSAGSRTALGTRARIGAVAVDPRVIPLGSKLYIESADGFQTYGYAVAEDTGGAIKGKRIDLFYGSSAEARRFGRRNVVVYVLEN